MDRRLEIFDILCSARMLQALPDVRRRALIESVRRTETAEGAIDVLLENLSSSPYIPQERKDQLAELAMTQQFAALRTALGPHLSEGSALLLQDTVAALSSQEVLTALFGSALKPSAGIACAAALGELLDDRVVGRQPSQLLLDPLFCFRAPLVVYVKVLECHRWFSSAIWMAPSDLRVAS